MMRAFHNSRSIIKAVLFTLFVITVGAAGGQLDEDDKRLSTKVKLSFSSGTVAEVLSDLSRQSGVKVEPSEAIGQRRITLFLSGIPAFRALDAIADLNDWHWSRTEPGHYLVVRKSVRAPQSIPQVPRAMGQVFPREIRTYLGLNGWYDKELMARSRHEGRPSATYESTKDRDELLQSLHETLVRDGSVAWAKLTVQDRDKLLFYLLFARLQRYSDVLYDESMPHSMVPEKTVLEADRDHPNVFMVNMHLPNGVVGFGGGTP
jgi:hypothetical protein